MKYYISGTSISDPEKLEEIRRLKKVAELSDEKQIISQTIRQKMWALGFRLLVYLGHSTLCEAIRILPFIM